MGPKERFSKTSSTFDLSGQAMQLSPGRPVSEYSIAPVMNLSDSHTEQSALEKRCLTDVRLLLEQTAKLSTGSAQLLPFMTTIKLSDISSVLWKESAHRCTQIEVLLQQGEVYTYEILDSISSRRLRLNHYVNDHAFMLRVQQECSRSVLTKHRYLTDSRAAN